MVGETLPTFFKESDVQLILEFVEDKNLPGLYITGLLTGLHCIELHELR